MTKADIVTRISDKTGMERADVQATVEAFMKEVRNSLETGDNVYLRGFGSFIIKKRAEKTGRNISRNSSLARGTFISTHWAKIRAGVGKRHLLGSSFI